MDNGTIPRLRHDCTDLPLGINQEARLIVQSMVDSMDATGLPPLHAASAYVLPDDVRPESVRAALETICRRHASLRSGFHLETRPHSASQVEGLDDRENPMARMLGSSRFRQVLYSPSDVPVRVEHVDVCWSEGNDSLFRVADLIRQPFDLRQPPLMRAALLTSAERQVLMLVVHHLVSDGWSAGIIRRDLARACGSESSAPSPDPPIEFADFAVWQRRQLRDNAWAASIAYWRERWRRLGAGQLYLADFPGVTATPARPTFAAGRECLVLDPALAQQLRLGARQQRATVHTLLLTACLLALCLYTGKRQVVVWSHFANRRMLESELVVGWIANWHIVGLLLPPSYRLCDALSQVNEDLLDASEHQQVPEAATWDAIPSGRSDTWMSFDTVIEKPADNVLEKVELPPTTIVPGLQLVAVDRADEGIILRTLYSAENFPQREVQRLQLMIKRIAEMLVQSPEASVERLSF